MVFSHSSVLCVDLHLLRRRIGGGFLFFPLGKVRRGIEMPIDTFPQHGGVKGVSLKDCNSFC